ncbi:hypothetical protein DKG77_07410 [Flagellimonas aquimarina]|uniref:histidine kinase n=1 Tax=Flagellimonas aquimarina TaxID=2201895 RepID=A0A316KV62_9FLAO|nr:ATP-binding protein [Allomuricauda koreensis]PWL38112.1 hypothetical protein DKG77_07410 [Allomuricauda koreensis]
MSTYKFLLIISFGSFLFSCQQEKSHTVSTPLSQSYPLDSFQLKPADTIVFEEILLKSKFFEEKGNHDSVLKYDKLLMTLATETNALEYRAKGESYVGYDFREAQQFDSAFYYYQRAKNSFLELSDSTQVGRKLLNMGQLQYRQNDFYGSKESITEALQFFNKQKDKKFITWCWNELGNNYTSLNDFENAKNNYEKAINAEKNLVDKIIYINNLAILHSKNANYTKAIELLGNAIETIPEDFSEEEYARLIHNKAEAKWKLTNDNILHDYFIALKIRKNIGDKRGLLSSFIGFSEFYEHSNPDISKKYADTLIGLSKELKVPRAEIEALQILFRLKPDNIAYKNRYIFLQDSLYKEELKVKNQFAHLKYQDKEEKARLLALEAESAKQEAQLAQQETQKILFLSFSAVLLMGGTFLFFLLKQRHKKEKLKEIYNTEKHISQRLHDGLANDIFSLMARVENKERIKNTEFLDHLENIYARTREISHENSPVNIHEHFLDELKSLILTFQSDSITIVTKGLEDIQWATLSEQKCVALHRALKELLVNMKKHSQANLVGLQFSYFKKNIRLDYKDNGIGFPTDIKYGLGLQNAVSRIRSCGGTFTFTPKQGIGASIEISIPNQSGV